MQSVCVGAPGLTVETGGVEEGRETLPTGRASSPDLRLETGKTGKGVRANIRERNAT